MSPPEDSYGHAKRFAFVAEQVRAAKPASILDVGCGSGTLLTAPLARAFPAVSVTGTDADAASIAWAQQNERAENLRFLMPGEIPAGARFDMVIASEVLEHVEAPPGFLADLVGRLAPRGTLVVTVPNGYGPFEFLALAEVLLNLSGLQALLRRVKRSVAGTAQPATAATLAVSPHVNFFGFAELGRLFAAAGLAVERYRARTLLCGYLADGLVRGPRLVAWNAAIADRLPPWCASDWMFALRPHTTPVAAAPWRRGAWARLRKRLNERRWRLA